MLDVATPIPTSGDRPRLRCLPLVGDALIALVTVLTYLLTPAAAAQDGAADVHVTPRELASAASQRSLTPALHAQAKPIVKDVNVVLVPVTVTDPMGRPVAGLEKEHFTVFEGQVQQQIQYFSSEDTPVSIGVLFDLSGSMSDKIDAAREAIAEFLKTANPEDEFFVITFSDRPELVSDFASSPEDVQAKLLLVAPKGRTALLDAIYLGLNKAAHGRHPRRALLIISDGGDNNSRYSEQEVKAMAKEADTLIYAIGIHTTARTPEEHLGPLLLGEIAEATGGHHFTLDRPQDLADVTTKIGYLLRNQYVLGYRPSNPVHDGRWHKIKVKLQPPKGAPRLTVYAKTGYYAPAN
jgi:Ca-activated chloride channel family protein